MAEEKTNEHIGHREQLQDFIESYRSETCLWKTKSKDYHDRSKKNVAYKRLVEKYKAIDPNANRVIVVKKINNLRTTYRKELNKMIKSYSSGAVYTPRLWYFELLSFLYNQEIPQRPSISNTDEDEHEKHSIASIGSNSNDRDTPSPNHSDSDQDTPIVPVLDYTNKKQPTSAPKHSDSEQTTPPSNRSRPKSRKNALIEDLLQSVNDHFKRPKQPENHFEVFGKYVGMKLQELPREQRIIAEKIINETLFLAEMGSLTTAHTVRMNE